MKTTVRGADEMREGDEESGSGQPFDGQAILDQFHALVEQTGPIVSNYIEQVVKPAWERIHEDFLERYRKSGMPYGPEPDSTRLMQWVMEAAELKRCEDKAREIRRNWRLAAAAAQAE